MPHRDKRQLIMQAVARLMTQKRWHEITTDQIAHAARVGKGTIYRHFEDKDDVFFQVSMGGFDDLCALLERRVPCGVPFVEQLRHACEQISQFFANRRNLFRMMHVQEAGPVWRNGRFAHRWREARQRLRQSLAQILQRGLDEGLVRSDIPAEALAIYLLGMLRTRAREMHEFDENARRIDRVVDLFCHGAAPGAKLEVSGVG